MKKLLTIILSLILALTMVFSLVGCDTGSNNNDDDDDDSKSSSQTDSDEDTSSKTDSDEDTSSKVRVDEDTSSKNDNKNDEFSRGKINGNEYENEFLNIKFTKPSSWNFLSDEEILKILLDGSSEDKELEEMLDSGVGIYDAATRDALGNSVLFGIVDLSVTKEENLTEQDYIDSVTAMLSASGYEFGDEYVIELGDEEYLASVGSIVANGINVNQAYYVRKTGKYMSFVIVTTFTEDIEDIEAMFS